MSAGTMMNVACGVMACGVMALGAKFLYEDVQKNQALWKTAREAGAAHVMGEHDDARDLRARILEAAEKVKLRDATFSHRTVWRELTEEDHALIRRFQLGTGRQCFGHWFRAFVNSNYPRETVHASNVAQSAAAAAA